MAESMTHKYIPRVEQRQENLFIEEYYSSTDTKIFMNDEEQSEISYISYNLREQLRPIYGYSSRTFDDMAIGARLVSGVFKVPIKNAEAQTPIDEIIKYGNNINTDSYNDNQEKLIESIEWITGENNATNTAIIENNETYEYKIKLIKLGYDLEYNSTPQVLKEQIKKFQKDNNISPEDGILTSSTKEIIDNEILKSNLKKIKLEKGTKIYLKPIFNEGDVITMAKKNTEVYILNSDYSNGWYYIMTENEIKGWVNIKEE